MAYYEVPTAKILERLTAQLSDVSFSKSDAAIFDIDDTLLRPMTREPIPEVVNFYNFLKTKGCTMFIITARINIPYIIEHTKQDLANIGVSGYDSLYLRNPTALDIPHFKLESRKHIVQQGYKPVFSLGDMWWDIGLKTQNIYQMKLQEQPIFIKKYVIPNVKQIYFQELCYESFPCKHYVSVVDSKGKTHVDGLINGRKLWQRFKHLQEFLTGEFYAHFHKHDKSDVVEYEYPASSTFSLCSPAFIFDSEMEEKVTRVFSPPKPPPTADPNFCTTSSYNGFANLSVDLGPNYTPKQKQHLVKRYCAEILDSLGYVLSTSGSVSKQMSPKSKIPSTEYCKFLQAFFSEKYENSTTAELEKHVKKYLEKYGDNSVEEPNEESNEDSDEEPNEEPNEDSDEEPNEETNEEAEEEPKETIQKQTKKCVIM